MTSSRAVNEAMSVATAAPLALFHFGVVSELVHRHWGRQQQQQQGQMAVTRELFTGLGMPAMAAATDPTVQYTGLDKLHVLNALQAAYQTADNRSQVAALAAHCASSWGVEGLQADSISNLRSTGFPAGVHGTVVQLVLQLLSLCAPYKGHEDLKILTTGLKMLQLVLSDAALAQYIQHNFADIVSSSTVSIGGSSGTAAAAGSRAAAVASPSTVELAGAILGPLVTVVGPLCAKGQADHPFAAQLFPPMPWAELLAAEEGGDLLPLCGGLLRDVLLIMSPAGVCIVGGVGWGAVEEGADLLPLFCGLLRDVLLVMSPAGVCVCGGGGGGGGGWGAAAIVWRSSEGCTAEHEPCRCVR